MERHLRRSTRDFSRIVRPGTRSPELVAFEVEVVSFFLDAAELLSIPKSVAAIYGICFTSVEPLSFSDIVERLNISTGSISQGLRFLKEVGALKAQAGSLGNPKERVKADGVMRSASFSRRGEAAAYLGTRGAVVTARYTPDLELRNLVLRWIEKRLAEQLGSGQSRLDAIMSSIPPGVNRNALYARFESIATWHRKARAMVPIAKAFLKLT